MVFQILRLAEFGIAQKKTFMIRRKKHGILPVYKMVRYMCSRIRISKLHIFTELMKMKMNQFEQIKKVSLVLGSGPIRIGQGVEFDYATVHSVWAIKEAGYEAIIINNNPETVSTDFSISDKLYFEPLTIEDVMHIIEL